MHEQQEASTDINSVSSGIQKHLQRHCCFQRAASGRQDSATKHIEDLLKVVAEHELLADFRTLQWYNFKIISNYSSNEYIQDHCPLILYRRGFHF